jgi:hypothetical protein
MERRDASQSGRLWDSSSGEGTRAEEDDGKGINSRVGAVESGIDVE